MFRLRLHPTPSGFLAGFTVLALWALLWLWVIAQLVLAPRPAAVRTPAPVVTAVMDAANWEP